MAMVRPKARILERTITAGNGPYTLGGAVDLSYNTFSAFMADGDTTYISVVEPGVAFWTGIGTYGASGNTMTLTTVEETKGTFGAGTKEIMSGALASTSMFREDIAGAIVTGGTSTAYTVASYRKYDTLTRLDGNIIAFTPHTTNGATVTLNVDGLGAKPLRTAPATELLAGTIIHGTPYLAVYNHTDDAFYLHGFFGNPYNIPLGSGMDYWLPTAPNSSFVFPVGQAISRTTYATLFAAMGTTYGAGNGSTTFNLPDKSGRVSVPSDVMSGSQANRVNLYLGNGLGSAGGSQDIALPQSALPNAGLTFNGTPATITVTSTISTVDIGITQQGTGPGTGFFVSGQGAITSTGSYTPSGFVDSMNGGVTQTATELLQPSIVCNYILRII
jgi:microcystin-dependent protein